MTTEKKDHLKIQIDAVISNIRNLLSDYLRDYLVIQKPDIISDINYQTLISFCDTRLTKLSFEINQQEFITNDSVFSLSIYTQLTRMLRDINKVIEALKRVYSPEVFGELLDIAARVNDISKEISMVNLAVEHANKNVQPAIDQALENIRTRVAQMDNVLLAIETSETDKIYKNASEEFGRKAWDYEFGFYVTLGVSLILFFISMFVPELTKNSDVIVYVKYFLVKLVLLATTITLCTIFGRKGSHFRKLQDQAFQTHLELNAFPLHTNRLPPEDKNYLIKELALKYFGKEVDQTQNDKIGDLIHDQIKAGTELIRASADMVKVVKPSTASNESEEATTSGKPS